MRLLEWLRDHPKVVDYFGTVAGLVALGLLVAGMLWLDSVLPQHLIPWNPVERM